MKYACYCLLFFLLSCSNAGNTVKIKGSDTEVNLAVQLAESFHKASPKVFVSISGGGSGLGIASLLNGTSDIANSSRSIHPEELALFKKENIQIDSFIFAQDAIAFVVSNELPIDSISTANLAEVLNGNFINWSSIISKNLPITIYGRQSNSGTHDYVKKKLKIEFSQYAKQMNGNAQILEAIRADHSGIGYVGAGYLINGGNKGLKILSIYSDRKNKAVSPLDAVKIAQGNYFFQRPLFQYYRHESYKTIKPFIEFEKTDVGKKIISDAGYYPVLN